MVLGSGKRGGVGNSFLIFGPSAWVACWAATQPIQRKEVLETSGPFFQTGKLFLIEGHAPSKLCPRFQFVELKANSAITWAVNKIYCLMMHFFFLQARMDLSSPWFVRLRGKHKICFLCFYCIEKFHCVLLLRLGSNQNCRGQFFLWIIENKFTLLTF